MKFVLSKQTALFLCHYGIHKTLLLGINTSMVSLIPLQFTILVLLLLGFILKRTGIITKSGQKDITNLVIDVILPCNTLAGFCIDVSPVLLHDCLWVLFLSVIAQLICGILGKVLYCRAEKEKEKCLRYALICSNAGFLGTPIAEGLFGTTGTVLANVYLIPLRIMMWSEGVAVFTEEKDWRITLKKVLLNPCIVACEIGLFLFITGITLPPILLAPLQTIGKCNTALSLMVVGMILADIDPHHLLDKSVLHYTVHRLVLIPALLFGISKVVPVTDISRSITVLLAAMPAGATTSMLASKYDCDSAYATKLVVFSTLCSIPAILLWDLIIS